MSSGRVPRLGLLARLGFGGAVGALVLIAAVTIDIRQKRGIPPALERDALTSQSPRPATVKARLDKADSIGAFLGGGKREVEDDADRTGLAAAARPARGGSRPGLRPAHAALRQPED